MSKNIAGYIYFGGKKKRSVYGYNPDIPQEEAEEGVKAKHRFLRNVSRLIRIMQLERKGGEDKLTDAEKLQLIKLDREFDHYEVVATLEREETGRREFMREQAKTEEPLTNTWKEEGSDPHSWGDTKKRGFGGKIQPGGKSEGKESQLKAVLIRHKKAVGWTEEEYLRKVKAAAGKKGGAVTATITQKRKKEGKKGIGGRKKGTKFDARVKRFVSKEEKEELDKNGKRRRGDVS